MWTFFLILAILQQLTLLPRLDNWQNKLQVRTILSFLLVLAVTGGAPHGAAAQTRSAKQPAAPKPSAPKPTAPETFPIDAIHIEGNEAYVTEAVIALTGLRIGSPASREVFEAARDRLLAAEVFSSVGFRYQPGPAGGYEVTLEVAEIEQRFPFRFARIPAEDAALRERLRKTLPLYTEEIPATNGVLDRYGKAIREYLEARGTPMEIAARVTADRPEELFVLFYPKGFLPVVAEVYFRGNEVILTPVLQNTIARVAVGSEYREERFRELLERNIRPLYEERGRVRVKFPKLEAKEAANADGLAVTVDVEEGEVYQIGEVTFEGVGDAEAEVRKSAGFKDGDLASAPRIEAAIERVKAGFHHGGHMKVAASFERDIDDENKKVNYTIRLDPGPQYRFGRLFVKGLDILGEAEIKRIWGLDPGKPFQSGYPDFFLEHVREQRLFENLGRTRAILTPNHDDLTVDVTLEFSTEPRQPKGVLK